jgi:hypothetical protein
MRQELLTGSFPNDLLPEVVAASRSGASSGSTSHVAERVTLL